MWRRMKLHADLAGAGGEALASAEIERNPGPPPVVDQKLDSHISFDVGVGLYLRLLAIAGTGLTVHHTGKILTANDLAGDLLGGHGPDGAEQFDFFVADAFRFERN